MNADDLFEADSPLGHRVRERGGDPIAAARAAMVDMSEADKIATLNAHPRIGETRRLSARSRAEQGGEDDPRVLAELARLNTEYERRFGFRFVVFVNRRPRSAILELLRERLGRPRDVELAAGLEAIVAIAEDRLRGR